LNTNIKPGGTTDPNTMKTDLYMGTSAATAFSIRNVREIYQPDKIGLDGNPKVLSNAFQDAAMVSDGTVLTPITCPTGTASPQWGNGPWVTANSLPVLGFRPTITPNTTANTWTIHLSVLTDNGN